MDIARLDQNNDFKTQNQPTDKESILEQINQTPVPDGFMDISKN